MIPFSFGIIVKNNPQIGILLQLVRDFVPSPSEIVVLDTGSTDATVAMAKKYADRVEVFTDCNDTRPGPDHGKILDFSMAREKLFTLCQHPTFLWADSDDEIAGLEHLQSDVELLHATAREQNKPVAFFYRYEYAYDEKGRVILTQDFPRLISYWRGWTWQRERFPGKKPVEWVPARDHEVLSPFMGRSSIYTRHRNTMVWKHRQMLSQNRDPNRDMRILRYSMEEEKKRDGRVSARTQLCWAKELSEHSTMDPFLVPEAREASFAYLRDNPDADGQTSVLMYLAKIACQQNEWVEALDWGMRAFLNAQGDTTGDPAALLAHHGWVPGSQDAAFLVGKVLYSIGEERRQKDADDIEWRREFSRAARFLEVGLASPQVNPLGRGQALLCLHHVYSALGYVDRALVAAKQGAEIEPDLFKEHIAHYERHIRRDSVLATLGEMYAKGDIPEPTAETIAAALAVPVMTVDDAMSRIPSAGPRGSVGTPPHPLGPRGIVELSEDGAIERQKIYEEANRNYELQKNGLDIVLACGNTELEWNPKLVDERGVGGSETAACDLARGLAARGHRVRVYNRCGEPGVYDGVEYLPTEHLEHGVSAEVCIAWRNALTLPKVKAKKKIAWVHDTSMLFADKENMADVDVVVALSEWHKHALLENHPFLRDERSYATGTLMPRGDMRVFGSAIRLENFDTSPERRNPHLAVCSSSFERYLLAMVEIWPRVREQVPDAQLLLFGNYEGWRKRANYLHSEWLAYFDRKRPMLEKLGVTFHPRVSPLELAGHLMLAGVWLYPTNWAETWLAAAADAQAAGLFSVTSPIGGIPEMLRDNATYVRGKGRWHTWWLEPVYQDAFVKATVDTMHDGENNPPRDRDSIRKQARERFAWGPLLEKWDALVRE